MILSLVSFLTLNPISTHIYIYIYVYTHTHPLFPTNLYCMVSDLGWVRAHKQASNCGSPCPYEPSGQDKTKPFLGWPLQYSNMFPYWFREDLYIKSFPGGSKAKCIYYLTKATRLALFEPGGSAALYHKLLQCGAQKSPWL